jgi:hypothetical protein
MTWQIKVLRVASTVGIISALALASGADFIDFAMRFWW